VLICAYFDKNLYIDEIFAFGESNSKSVVLFLGNDYLDISYTPEQAKDYLEVSGNERFNYFLPYYSASNDNHPPMFFYMIHTVSSLFPDSYSKWYGVAVEFPFYIATIFLLYRLSRRVFKSKNKALLCAFLYAFSPFGLWNALIIRMYQPLTFFILLVVYAATMYYKTYKTKYLLYYAIGIFYSGMLHYSAYFFNFFLTLFVCLVFLTNKQIKRTLSFGISAVIGVLLACAAWAYTILQFTYTTTIRENWQNRTAEARENITRVFTDPLLYIVLIAAVLFVIYRKKFKGVSVIIVCALLSAGVASIFINSMYVMHAPRYYFFIIPVVLFGAMYFIPNRVLNLSRAIALTLSVVFAAVSIGYVALQDEYKAYNFRTYFNQGAMSEQIRGKSVIVAVPVNDPSNYNNAYFRDLIYILSLFNADYTSVTGLYLPPDQLQTRLAEEIALRRADNTPFVVIGLENLTYTEQIPSLDKYTTLEKSACVVKGWKATYVFYS
jgi:uncharacterized membrane protein